MAASRENPMYNAPPYIYLKARVQERDINGKERTIGRERNGRERNGRTEGKIGDKRKPKIDDQRAPAGAVLHVISVSNTPKHPNPRPWYGSHRTTPPAPSGDPRCPTLHAPTSSCAFWPASVSLISLLFNEACATPTSICHTSFSFS
jgi:hypothetical protein